MTPAPARSQRIADKILQLDDLARLVRSLQAEGKTVVHCHGVFDLMHLGHIRHFEEAKTFGHLLIVTVTPDQYVNKGPNRPVFTEAHRAEAIAALASVDYVAINKWPTASDTIKLLRPNVFVKGQEYRNAAKDRTGGIVLEEEAVRASGGRIAFTDDVVFSSSALLNRHFAVFPEATERFLASFSEKYSAESVLANLEQTRHSRILVLGEAIIDEYNYCETLGKAGKEPILVARHISKERFSGGVLAVANHVSAVCERVTMLTFLGEFASEEDFVREQTKAEIEKIFLYTANAPTIVKKRFLESYPLQKLFEVYVMTDFERQGSQSAELSRKLLEVLPNFDAVVVADYGHGMITPDVAELLSQEAKFLAINTQLNAGNHGFNTVSKYRRADYICVSEKEIRMEARSPHRELRDIIKDVSEKLACSRILITRGSLGCLCYGEGEGFYEVPAFTGQVVDRIGAGDAVLAVTSVCAAQHAAMEIIGFLGSCVGSQAVGVIGNRSFVDRIALSRHIECLLK